MPRRIRLRSAGCYYHVIVKGNSGQIIFEDSSDYEFFIKTLRKVKGEIPFKLIAYCLMDNHVHLLLRDEEDVLPEIMKKIEVIYSIYFNSKYERRGHLFYDRYRSIPINSERQLAAVFRYILNNPYKAGIDSATGYRWGCFCEYSNSLNRCGVVDVDLGKELFGGLEHIEKLIASFDPNDRSEAEELGVIDKNRMFDSEAIAFMRDNYGEMIFSKLLSMNRKDRNDLLRELKSAGLSVRQISRLTGISRSVVQRA